MHIHRSVPLSDQVNEVLRERIRKEYYPPGGRIPSEAELSQEFEVSRATIRTVLTRLAGEGLIFRKQGDGTYVNERLREVTTHTGGLWEFERLIETSGYNARIVALVTELSPASEIEAEALGVTFKSELLRLKRLFYADEQAAILANNVIPGEFLRRSPENIDGRLGIKALLQRYCQQKISFAITEVRAEFGDSESRILLELDAEDPLLVLMVTFYNRNNQAIAYGRSLLRDDLLRLRLVQAWS